MTIQDIKIELNKEKTMKKTQTEMKLYQRLSKSNEKTQWKASPIE